MLADRTALLDGVGHEVLGLLVAAENCADQADRLRQAGIVGGVFVAEGRVKLCGLRRIGLEDRDGDDGDADCLDLPDHLRRRVMRHERDLRPQRGERLDVDRSELAAGRQARHPRREPREARPELRLPVVHDADEAVRRAELGDEVEGVVLQHDRALDRVGQRHAPAELIDERALGP